MIVDFNSGHWTENLVNNGEFNRWKSVNNPSNFVITQTGASAVTKSTVSKSGDYSLRAFVASGQTVRVNYEFNFEKGKTYKVVIFYRVTALLPIRIKSYLSTPTGSFNQQVTPAAINTWYKFEKTFKANGNDDGFIIENNSSSYYFYIDNMQIYEYEPTVVEMTG